MNNSLRKRRRYPPHEFLPRDVIIEIFTYCTFEEVRVVCREWNQLSFKVPGGRTAKNTIITSCWLPECTSVKPLTRNNKLAKQWLNFTSELLCSPRGSLISQIRVELQLNYIPASVILLKVAKRIRPLAPPTLVMDIPWDDRSSKTTSAKSLREFFNRVFSIYHSLRVDGSFNTRLFNAKPLTGPRNFDVVTRLIDPGVYYVSDNICMENTEVLTIGDIRFLPFLKETFPHLRRIEITNKYIETVSFPELRRWSEDVPHSSLRINPVGCKDEDLAQLKKWFGERLELVAE